MTKQPIIFIATAGVGLLMCAHNVFGAPSTTPAPPIEAERLAHTPEGAAYQKACADAIASRLAKAFYEGMDKLKLHPPQEVNITFVMSARGQITDTLVPADQLLSAYVARKLIGSAVPKPPHDAYPVRLRMGQRRRIAPIAPPAA